MNKRVDLSVSNYGTTSLSKHGRSVHITMHFALFSTPNQPLAQGWPMLYGLPFVLSVGLGLPLSCCVKLGLINVKLLFPRARTYYISEFGIRETCYAIYRYAVVGEIAISLLAQSCSKGMLSYRKPVSCYVGWMCECPLQIYLRVHYTQCRVGRTMNIAFANHILLKIV